MCTQQASPVATMATPNTLAAPPMLSARCRRAWHTSGVCVAGQSGRASTHTHHTTGAAAWAVRTDWVHRRSHGYSPLLEAGRDDLAAV